MASSSSLMLPLKAILISTGVVSIAMLMKFSVPLMLNFAVYEIPLIWSVLLSWLRPPYLYVVINGIIITIAATSRFHQKLDESSNSNSHNNDNTQSEPLVRTSSATQPSDLPRELPIPSAFGIIEPPVVVEEVYESEPRVMDVRPVIINGTAVVSDERDEYEQEEEFVISKSSWAPPPQRMDSLENLADFNIPVTEKPLVSSRFSHRRPIKSSPEGGTRALRVAKTKRHETLETTWKTITDGRHMPLTRHLRKSDTWNENNGRHIHVMSTHDPASSDPVQMMHKSETFKDRTNYSSPMAAAALPAGSPKLRREASPSQDELNRRVESFIRKFNEDMRMQRQESLNQYNEMLKRGAH